MGFHCSSSNWWRVPAFQMDNITLKCLPECSLKKKKSFFGCQLCSYYFSSPLVGGGHHYIVPIYTGNSELFQVSLCRQKQLHNLWGRMKFKALVHKVLLIPRGQQKNIKWSLRPCVTAQVTHSKAASPVCRHPPFQATRHAGCQQ